MSKFRGSSVLIKSYVLALFILLWNYHAYGFNFDIKNYAVLRGSSESMFGFAVAGYRSSRNQSGIFVGAPDHQRFNGGGNGTVYKCGIYGDNDCVPMKSRYHNLSPYSGYGDTVFASKQPGGPYGACAPKLSTRVTFQTMKGPLNDLRIYGSCAYYTENEEVPLPSLCRNKTNNYENNYSRRGLCQAGFGVSLSRDDTMLFVGAPGSWYWQGEVFPVSLKQNPTLKWSMPEESIGHDDAYAGYSIAAGDFYGDGKAAVAVGAPRGNDLKGFVLLYTNMGYNYLNITGEQMAAYFGYAMISGDFNCDGIDDLVISAPMYTIVDNPDMKIETGRIYVIYRDVIGHGFTYNITRDGEGNQGRFGSSLAFLGDIDRDGCGDFAVGAPYDGSDGGGAVYIFHGSRERKLDERPQVIYSENLERPVRTFGFSLSGDVDLDGNLYPDLVVGSYESGSVFVFRAQPIMQMTTSVKFDTLSRLISLNDTQCTLTDRTDVFCTNMRICFKYDGDSLNNQYQFDLKYVLDVQSSKIPRMFFIEDEGNNIKHEVLFLTKGKDQCRQFKVYIHPEIRDKLTSFEAEVRMNLTQNKFLIGLSRDPKAPLQPVIAMKKSENNGLIIRKNCGSDNICIPNLQLNCTMPILKYYLGSGERLNLTVRIQNSHHDAFEAVYKLTLPNGVDYINVKQMDKTNVLVRCSVIHPSNNASVLHCDIGNPLMGGHVVNFNVLLQPNFPSTNFQEAFYQFDMMVNSSNPEDSTTLDDNLVQFKLPIGVQTGLFVEGESKPKDLYYNPNNHTTINITREIEIGPLLTHNYTVRNEGPFDLDEVKFDLIWPAKTLTDEDLLYLLEQPETSGFVTCETANFNYHHVKLESRKREQTSYLKPNRIFSTGSYSSNHADTRKQSGYETNKKKIEQEGSFGRSGESWSSSSSSSTDNTREKVSASGASFGTIDTIHKHNATTNERDFSEKNKFFDNSGTNIWIDRSSTNHHEGTIIDGRTATTFPEGDLSSGSTEASTESSHRRNHHRTNVDTGVTYEDNRENSRTQNKNHQSIGKGFQSNEDSFLSYNFSSAQDMDALLNSLSTEKGSNEMFNGQSKYNVRFKGKFAASADGKEYIQFEDGSTFLLKDHLGDQSYLVGSLKPGRSEFSLVEGQLIIDPDRRVCIELKDGRKFFIQHSFTYTEERTHTLSPGNRYDTVRQYENYSDVSWKEETYGKTINTDRRYESRYDSRIHEERNREILEREDVNYDKDNAYTSEIDPNAINSRFRRDDNPRPTNHRRYVDESSTPLNKVSSCEYVQCFTLRCTISSLKKNEEVWLASRYRIKVQTLNKIAFQEKVKIYTQLKARVTKHPFLSVLSDEIVRSYEIHTNVEPTVTSTSSGIVPLWVVVLSACIGTIILLLLIYLLHKCGFFKRNRPSPDAPERQPLNRNIQNGDDHL